MAGPIPKHVRIIAVEIVGALQMGEAYFADPYRATRFGLTAEQAKEILSLHESAFGPGKKGWEWAVKKVSAILVRKPKSKSAKLSGVIDLAPSSKRSQ